MTQLIPIKGQIQAYQWGGFDYLPALLHYHNSLRQPQAEYWLGTHPAAPAVTQDQQPLAELLSKHKCSLNFLLKILDVRDMLSIQVHPSKSQAEIGFADENRQGIALSAAHRNYKDSNHKPELMVALSEFWLLHGFKDDAAIAASLAPYAYLQPLRQCLITHGLRAAFELALSKKDPVVEPMVAQLQADFATRLPLTDKTTIEFWIQRWLSANPTLVNGLLTLFFLNIVKVEPGAAMYQPAGLLHAYLEGQNIELMAASDNVLRAGLTPKHIDVPELLKICTLQATTPSDYRIAATTFTQGAHSQEKCFPTPFTEFELSVLQSSGGGHYDWHAHDLEIIIALAGQALIISGEQRCELRPGEALLIMPGAEIHMTFGDELTECYRAKNL